MVFLGNFDASQVEPTRSREPLPPGEYTAMIIASDLKPNKARTGNYLELRFAIIEGEYKGRQLTARLNLDNPNEVAVKIARAELAAICRAVGVAAIRDSVELHNIPLVIVVEQEQRRDNNQTTNRIRAYRKKEDEWITL